MCFSVFDWWHCFTMTVRIRPKVLAGYFGDYFLDWRSESFGLAKCPVLNFFGCRLTSWMMTSGMYIHRGHKGVSEHHHVLRNGWSSGWRNTSRNVELCLCSHRIFCFAFTREQTLASLKDADSGIFIGIVECIHLPTHPPNKQSPWFETKMTVHVR